MPQVTYQVGASDDDAYNVTWGPACYKSSTAIQFGYEIGVYRYAGFRFTGVMLDGDSHEIVSAVLRVKAKEDTDQWIQQRVYGEDADNAGDFSANCADMETSRTRTTACSDLILHIDEDDGDWYDLPDCAAAVQEVIDRGGWSPGNALVMLLYGNIASGGQASIHSYDSDPDYAPQLLITYRYKGFAGAVV